MQCTPVSLCRCTCLWSPSSLVSCWPRSQSCPLTCGASSVHLLLLCAFHFRTSSQRRYQLCSLLTGVTFQQDRVSFPWHKCVYFSWLCSQTSPEGWLLFCVCSLQLFLPVVAVSLSLSWALSLLLNMGFFSDGSSIVLKFNSSLKAFNVSCYIKVTVNTGYSLKPQKQNYTVVWLYLVTKWFLFCRAFIINIFLILRATTQKNPLFFKETSVFLWSLQ